MLALLTATISIVGVAQASVSSVNIFGSTAPTNVSDTDPNAVEVGTKFNVQRAGTIGAIRFYKGKANIGQHVGNLWDGSGKRLATVTFANESASGWQTANLPAPVLVQPGVTYVVSYHTNVGHYSGDQYFFAGKGAGKYAVRALADGVSGGSGVYKYGSGSAFPTSTYRASNYWVDVSFRRLSRTAASTTTTAAPTSTTKAPTTTTKAPATTTTTKAPTTTTTAPVRPPTGSVPCALNIAAKACWAANTGVPGWTEAQIVAGQSPLVHSVGNITVTTPGTVIENRWIDGCVAVEASNVTIRNSLIRTSNACFGGDGQAGAAAISNGNGQGAGSPTNLQIIDTEVDAGQTDDGYDYIGIGSANYSLLRVNAHGTTHTVWAGTNVTIRDSFIHDPTAATVSRHNEAIDMDSGARVTVDHSWISAWNGNTTQWVTGGLMNGGSWGPPHDNVITNNFLEGGRGTDLLVATAAYNTRITGNRLSPNTAYGNQFTYSFQPNAGNVWSDNRQSESLAIVNP